MAWVEPQSEDVGIIQCVGPLALAYNEHKALLLCRCLVDELDQ